MKKTIAAIIGAFIVAFSGTAVAGIFDSYHAYNTEIASTTDAETNYFNIRTVYSKTVREYASKKGLATARRIAAQNVLEYINRLDRPVILNVIRHLEEGNPYSNSVKEMYYLSLFKIYNK